MSAICSGEVNTSPWPMPASAKRARSASAGGPTLATASGAEVDRGHAVDAALLHGRRERVAELVARAARTLRCTSRSRLSVSVPPHGFPSPPKLRRIVLGARDLEAVLGGEHRIVGRGDAGLDRRLAGDHLERRARRVAVAVRALQRGLVAAVDLVERGLHHLGVVHRQAVGVERRVRVHREHRAGLSRRARPPNRAGSRQRLLAVALRRSG